MDRTKLLEMLLFLFMVQFNMVEMKSYSKMAPVNESVTYDKVPGDRALNYHTILNVAPFPYIPDPYGSNNDHLLQFIKREFQAAHPGIQLILRPMGLNGSFYDMDVLKSFLTPDESGYDVVEIDTVVLGDLVATGLVTPQTYPVVPDLIPNDWHPAAAKAVQINQAIYAFPHLMCAIFLFTHGNAADKSEFETLDQLKRYMDNLIYVHSNPSVSYGPYRLVGNLNNSWDMSAIWIDSHRDKYYPTMYMEAEALHGYEHLSFETMRQFSQLCDMPGVAINLCLEGPFDTNYDTPAFLFSNYMARAMYGYSERLFHVFRNGPYNNVQDVKIQTLPLGIGSKQPSFFTDAYVFRRNLSQNKLQAAQAFVNFMATPRMQAAVVGNEDFAPVITYRYLLPMSRSAYNEPLLQADRFFRDYFRPLVGYPYPNTGLLQAHEKLAQDIRKYIKKE